jgi:hypothetical protein
MYWAYLIKKNNNVVGLWRPGLASQQSTNKPVTMVFLLGPHEDFDCTRGGNASGRTFDENQAFALNHISLFLKLWKNLVHWIY